MFDSKELLVLFLVYLVLRLFYKNLASYYTFYLPYKCRVHFKLMTWWLTGVLIMEQFENQRTDYYERNNDLNGLLCFLIYK